MEVPQPSTKNIPESDDSDDGEGKPLSYHGRNWYIGLRIFVAPFHHIEAVAKITSWKMFDPHQYQRPIFPKFRASLPTEDQINDMLKQYSIVEPEFHPPWLVEYLQQKCSPNNQQHISSEYLKDRTFPFDQYNAPQLFWITFPTRVKKRFVLVPQHWRSFGI